MKTFGRRCTCTNKYLNEYNILCQLVNTAVLLLLFTLHCLYFRHVLVRYVKVPYGVIPLLPS